MRVVIFERCDFVGVGLRNIGKGAKLTRVTSMGGLKISGLATWKAMRAKVRSNWRAVLWLAQYENVPPVALAFARKMEAAHKAAHGY